MPSVRASHIIFDFIPEKERDARQSSVAAGMCVFLSLFTTTALMTILFAGFVDQFSQLSIGQGKRILVFYCPLAVFSYFFLSILRMQASRLIRPALQLLLNRCVPFIQQCLTIFWKGKTLYPKLHKPPAAIL